MTTKTITPREAQKLARNLVRSHNADCENPIRTRTTGGAMQIALVGRGEQWFTCSTLLDLWAFADGVSDVESWGSAPAKLAEVTAGAGYDTQSERDAYAFAVAQSNACGAGHEADLCASAS